MQLLNSSWSKALLQTLAMSVAPMQMPSGLAQETSWPLEAEEAETSAFPREVTSFLHRRISAEHVTLQLYQAAECHFSAVATRRRTKLV